MGLTWEEWLAERPLAVIATAGADGMPHAVPIEVVVDGGRVYSWCRGDAARIANVERTGRAALVAYKGRAFVLVRGPARLLRADDARYAPLTRKFLDKYRREETYGNDTLIEITPERVSADGV